MCVYVTLNHTPQYKRISLYYLQAILTYWASANFISLIQTGLLKVPYIRKALDMPIRIKHASPVAGSNRNFVEEFRECKYYIVWYYITR